MKFTLLATLFAVALLSGCTAPNDAQKALKAQGFTDVTTGGYAFFGCGNDDAFHTEFTATNPTGQRVSGVVCSGWFKGATIRY